MCCTLQVVVHTSSLKGGVNLIDGEILSFAKLKFRFLQVDPIFNLVSSVQARKATRTEKSATFSFFFLVAFGMLLASSLVS